MKKPTPIVNQVLYAVPTGNRRRCGVQAHFVTVRKVGRKYFTVARDNSNARHMQDEVELGSWRHKSDTSPGFVLYASEQAYNDQKTANALQVRIKDYLSIYGNTDIPLSDLKQIASILKLP